MVLDFVNVEVCIVLGILCWISVFSDSLLSVDDSLVNRLVISIGTKS